MSDLTDYRDALGSDYVLIGADVAKGSQDWAGVYHWVPLAVLRPGSTEDVSAAVKIAARLGQDRAGVRHDGLDRRCLCRGCGHDLA